MLKNKLYLRPKGGAFLHRCTLFYLIFYFMVYFRVEVTDQAGFVVFNETYCSYLNAKKCFDGHLSFCDSTNYAVLMTAYSVREDLEHFDLQDLPF